MMTERVKDIVRKGRWLYDGTVPSEVWIIRQNYFEGPTITEEESDTNYPRRDGDGMFYYAAFAQQSTVKSVSNLFGSAEEAVQEADHIVHGITWD
jgi:hypothetical protein